MLGDVAAFLLHYIQTKRGVLKTAVIEMMFILMEREHVHTGSLLFYMNAFRNIVRDV